MNKTELTALLKKVESGDISAKEAAERIRLDSYDDLGYAKIDVQRGIRQGANEVVLGESKTKEQICGIVKHILSSSSDSVLITRLSDEAAEFLKNEIELFYDSVSKIGIAGKRNTACGKGCIVVATGGTSDIPVAEEAALTAEYYGNRVERLYDVGVAGLQRLLDNVDVLAGAKAVVAVAGMEGALASVIGGLVDCPVVAVPTSVGYGSSFEGIAALLSMLNSCAAGVSVVNIDNGFGAGYIANMINNR
ncbi:MAG: nickel pincer cofactor biosynthesis protein LarB [Clostridia bacterium]|nr:nickel pincer cofactor biosynthesis protein LarB [Clostridia bacterium]